MIEGLLDKDDGRTIHNCEQETGVLETKVINKWLKVISIFYSWLKIE